MADKYRKQTEIYSRSIDLVQYDDGTWGRTNSQTQTCAQRGVSIIRRAPQCCALSDALPRGNLGRRAPLKNKVMQWRCFAQARG